MRKLLIGYKHTYAVYPCGDRSIVENHLIQIDETKTVAELIDTLEGHKEPGTSEWIILGVATHEEK